MGVSGADPDELLTQAMVWRRPTSSGSGLHIQRTGLEECDLHVFLEVKVMRWRWGGWCHLLFLALPKV